MKGLGLIVSPVRATMNELKGRYDDHQEFEQLRYLAHRVTVPDTLELKVDRWSTSTSSGYCELRHQMLL